MFTGFHGGPGYIVLEQLYHVISTRSSGRSWNAEWTLEILSELPDRVGAFGSKL